LGGPPCTVAQPLRTGRTQGLPGGTSSPRGRGTAVDNYETSVIGTAVQVTGAGLIGILCYLLGRTVRHPLLRYWSAGWACLTVGLFALLIAFLRPASQPLTFRIFCYLEYGAGILFVAG